jgi:hypothetical protein
MPITPLKRLLFAQGGLCFFCESPLPATEASVEHLVAKAHGGSDGDHNCVACCKSLNALLGSKSLKEKIQVVLNQTGQFECPNGVQRKVNKTRPKASPKASPKATNSVAERYAKVVAHLKKLRNAQPRTVPKLKNTISALFPKSLSQDDVDELVRQLQASHVISINQAKLTYEPDYFLAKGNGKHVQIVA